MEPQIEGHRLRWDVDVPVAPLTAVKLHFGVRLPLAADGPEPDPEPQATDDSEPVVSVRVTD